MTIHPRFSLLDDDGVLVVASTAGLRKHYGSRKFQHRFPEELLECVSSGVVFAWQTGGEGEHEIEIVPGGSTPSPGHPTVSGALSVLPGDVVLVMPYSTYTFGCEDGGTFASRGRLAAEISVPPGMSSVVVERLNSAGSGCSFKLSVVPADRPAVAVTRLPGWPP